MMICDSKGHYPHRVASFMKYFLFLLCSAVVGCATIVGDSTHLMPISSNPNEAAVAITDEKGARIFTGTTPASVTLQKSDGSYWGGKDYTVKITKDGYAPQTISVGSDPNGWYIGGNIVFGGLIGWFIIDPLGGHMYNLSPDSINAEFSGQSTLDTQRENTPESSKKSKPESQPFDPNVDCDLPEHLAPTYCQKL